MKDKLTREDFLKAMTVLRACYPSMSRTDEGNWMTMVTTSYRLLTYEHGADAILSAVEDAWKYFPDRFPTAGQLKGLCVKAARRRGGPSPEREESRPELPQHIEEPGEDASDLEKGLARLRKRWAETGLPENPAKELGAVLETHGQMGLAAVIGRMRSEKKGTPREGDFCARCGKLKKGHEIMSPDCYIIHEEPNGD